MIKLGHPTQGQGGGATIGVMASPYYSAKHTEANTILGATGGDTNRLFLGLLQQWNDYHILSTPLLKATELANQKLYTDYFGQELDYLIPYKMECIKTRERIVDVTVSKVGRGIKEFPIVLSDQLSPGDGFKLGTVRNGFELRVSDSAKIEPFGNGDGWIHQVTIATNDPEMYIPESYLRAGIDVTKTDNRGGERAVHSSGLSRDRDGAIQQTYKTGNSELAISHTITSHGDMLGTNLDVKRQAFSGMFNYSNMSLADADGIMNYFNKDKDGKAIKGTRAWMPTIIDKMLRELALMKEASCTWNHGFSFTGRGDQRVDVPMGFYQQVKQRGHYFTYNDLGNIVGEMKGMMDQLFSNSRLVPKDRRIKFKMGMGALIEAEKSFTEYAFQTNSYMILNTGGSNFASKMFTGDLQNLKYEQPRVTSVNFPGYGWIDVEHNPALDVLDGDQPQQGFHGLFPLSSYIMWVEDVLDNDFSNAIPNGAKKMVKDGFNGGGDANIVMIQPKGYDDTISFQPGVGYSPTLNKFLGMSTSAQIAATDTRGFKVTAITTGEIFIKDASRIIFAEYVPEREF